MKQYKIMWEIELDAKDHLEAAKRALKIQRDPSSWAVVFKVIDQDTVRLVDLMSHTNPEPAAKPRGMAHKEEIVPLEVFKNKFGGHWGIGHPDLTIDDWKDEIANNDTRLGYWEWVWVQQYGR